MGLSVVQTGIRRRRQHMRDDVDPKLRQLAATMRKTPTEPERRLWWALRHSLPLTRNKRVSHLFP